MSDMIIIRRTRNHHCMVKDRPHPYNLEHARWYRDGKIIDRDTMRRKCYRAEDKFALDYPSYMKTFDTLERCGKYIEATMNTKAFQRRWPMFGWCKLKFNPNLRTYCWAGSVERANGQPLGGRISLAPWAFQKRSNLILLHELAHLLCPNREHHNRLWARTYTDLVGMRMGAEAKKLLKQYFREHNMLVNPYRQVSTNNAETLRVARRMRDSMLA